jgi:putative Ca2+/H+ antiporter (TMEM165/GDT1 family)
VTLISSPASQTDLNPQDSVLTAASHPLVLEDEITPNPIDLQSQADSQPSRLTWKVFASTFVTIFLAELGDKTQVSTLLMTAEFHAPWVVFAGAACALITTSLLGVLVGCWLAARLSPKTLDTSAGITLAMISVWLLWDVVHL